MSEDEGRFEQISGGKIPRKWNELLADKLARLPRDPDSSDAGPSKHKRGLAQYAWCVAAEYLARMPDRQLRELAQSMRREWEERPTEFARRLGSALALPESAAAVAGQIPAGTSPRPSGLAVDR